MDLPNAPASLIDLIDRASITDVVNAYAHGIDRRDWALYRSIFAEEVDIDFFTWAGIRTRYAAKDWVALVRATLAPFDSTQHTFTNLAIRLRGSEATCTVNMTARHNLMVDGRMESQTLGGYYTDQLVRGAQGWRIAGCALMITWEEGDRKLFERASALGARARIDVGLEGA